MCPPQFGNLAQFDDIPQLDDSVLHAGSQCCSIRGHGHGTEGNRLPLRIERLDDPMRRVSQPPENVPFEAAQIGLTFDGAISVEHFQYPVNVAAFPRSIGGAHVGQVQPTTIGFSGLSFFLCKAPCAVCLTFSLRLQLLSRCAQQCLVYSDEWTNNTKDQEHSNRSGCPRITAAPSPGADGCRQGGERGSALP